MADNSSAALKRIKDGALMPYTIKQLQSKCTSLQIAFRKMLPATLEERLLHSYGQEILNQLDSIFKEHAHDEKNIASYLKIFLSDTWSVTNSKEYNAKALSYTALPRHELTLFICELALFTAAELNQCLTEAEEPVGLIGLLMPSVMTKPNDDSPLLGPTYNTSTGKWQDVSIDLPTLLATHILGEGGFTLIPIYLLTKVPLDKDSMIANPYYQEGIHPQTIQYLNEDELYRLQGHSELTRAIAEAKENHRAISQDPGRLLTHLTRFLFEFDRSQKTHLRWANIGHCQGAIVDFKAYYDLLDENVKDQIPREVRDEIKTLLHFLPSARDDAEQVKAKLAVSALGLTSSLSHTVRHFAPHLYKITCSEKVKQKCEADALFQFNLAKQLLQASLDTQQYKEGTDKPGFSRRLFEEFKTVIAVTSALDLQVIQRLDEPDMDSVFQTHNLKQQVIHHLGSMENVMRFSLRSNLPRLKSLFFILRAELWSKALPVTLQDHQYPIESIISWFSKLDGKRIQLFCEALKDKYTSSGWLHILKHLDYARAKHVLAVVEGVFTGVSSQTLSQILIYELGYESSQALIDCIVANGMLKNLILNSGRSSAAEYCHLTDKLPRNLRDRVLRAVLQVGCASAVVNCQGSWSLFAFQHMPQERMLMLNHIKASLPKMIGSAFKFSNFLEGHSANPLTPEECSFISRAMKGRYAKLSCSIKEWIGAFRILAPEDCAAICVELRAQYPKLSAHDIFKIVNNSTAEHDDSKRKVIYEAITGNTTSKVVNLNFLNDLMREEFKSRQIQALYTQLESAGIKLAEHDQKQISDCEAFEVGGALELLADSKLLNQKNWDYIKTQQRFSAAIHSLFVLKQEHRNFSLTPRQLQALIECSQEEVFHFAQATRSPLGWALHLDVERCWLLSKIRASLHTPKFFLLSTKEKSLNEDGWVSLQLQWRNQLLLMNSCIKMDSYIATIRMHASQLIKDNNEKYASQSPEMKLIPESFSSLIHVFETIMKNLHDCFSQKDTQKITAFIERADCLKQLQELGRTAQIVLDEYREKFVPLGDEKYKDNCNKLSTNLLSLKQMTSDFQDIIIKIHAGIKMLENIPKESTSSSFH